MKANTTQGWNTLQEGTEHYLYRSVSALSFAKLEALVLRLRDCQNPCIAIPEIVRLANGEIYLKEPRGIRSVEDFLGTNPSTRAKLFVVQQLLKLLENLHSFVGTAHGDLHVGCLSIGLDDKLILGGISPNHAETTGDIESLKQLFVQFFSQPTEIEVLKSLKGSSLKRMRRSIKDLLAEDTWDDIQSDWSTAVQQTSIEESSEELHTEAEHNAHAGNLFDDAPFDFDDLDQTLDLGNPLDALDGMPEPQNIAAKQELDTLDALFDEFDDLDGLDDFDVFEGEVIGEQGDLEALPTPMNILTEASAASHDTDGEQTNPQEQSQNKWNEDEWSDVDLDGWLDDVPEPSGIQSNASVDTHETEAKKVSANATITPEMFSEGFEEDWFSTNEDTMPLNREMDLMSSEAARQTDSDLEEISDFDDDDDVTELFSIPQAPNLQEDAAVLNQSVIDSSDVGADQNDGSTEQLTSSSKVDSDASLSSGSLNSNGALDDVDWFNNTDTADFMLSDFELDELSAEASLQSANEIDEFSIEDDEFDVDDVLPNEAEIHSASQIEMEPEQRSENPLAETDIFSRVSILDDLNSDLEDSESSFALESQSEGKNTVNETASQSKDTKEANAQNLDDWFGPSTATDSKSSTDLEAVTSEPETDEQSIPKWMLVAGAAVVAGGAWAATQTRQVDTPSVHIDETQTKSAQPTTSEKIATAQATKTVTIEQEQEKPADTVNETVKDSDVEPKAVAVSKSQPKQKTSGKTASTKKVTKPKTKPAANKSVQSGTPFAKTKVTKPAESTQKTTVQNLPKPKKSPTVLAKPEVKVTAPVQSAVDSTDIKPAAETVETSTSQATDAPDAIAASLTQLVSQSQQEKPNESEQPAAETQSAEESNPWITEEDNTTAAPEENVKREDNTETAAVSEPLNEDRLDASTPIIDDNQAVEIEATVSETVVAEVNASERVHEDVVEAPTPKLASSTLSQMSKAAVSGSLSIEDLETLQKIPSSDSSFTRANAIVLTHAQQSNRPELIESSLDNILSIDENTHKPIYLLAMAQYQFNQQNIDKTREYLMQAEMNWANVERTQLSVLRAQRDNIVAHLSYISFLESGSEDSRLQSLTQFRKVQREARRARLQSLFEQAESKMQKLQRKR